MPDCFLAKFAPETPCEGRLVRCHLIAKQTLRKEALPGSYRTWVWGCGGIMGNAGHHGMLDHSRTLRVPREALPADVEEFAADHGLGWYLDREYGLRVVDHRLAEHFDVLSRGALAPWPPDAA